MSALKLFFLGPPRIELYGRTVRMDTRKAVAMLAHLALSGQIQTRDSLATFLWPEFDDKRAKAALRRTLSALKSAIEGHALAITRETIGLQADEYWSDVAQFEQHVQVKEWTEAVALYQGEFMAGFSLRDTVTFDDWQLMQREVLHRDLLVALEALCYQQQEEGSFAQAIDITHQWLRFDPLREEAHRQLMLLNARSGRRNKALSQFRDCVRILDEELGVPPLPETVALYESIRDNQIDILTDFYTNQSLEDGKIVRPSVPPFIGRKVELTQITRLYNQTGPDGRFLVIEGEAGIGKTRLAEDFLTALVDRGVAVLSARCYEGEHTLAYASLIQIMRSGLRQPGSAEKLKNLSSFALSEAGRLLPELMDGQILALPQESLEAPGAQNRFYEGIGEVLRALLNGPQPGVIWLDDAHWLDTASLESLQFLIRRWSGRPYLILLCWRTEYLPAAHPLYHLLADLRRAAVAAHLHLTRFTHQEVQELLQAVMPDHAPQLPQKLYNETEGLPYFVVEYLNALREQNLPGGLRDSWDLPRTVRDLLIGRLSQVGDQERQVLQTAAAIGHAFEYELLLLASGRSADEIVSSLDNLVDRGLLIEHSDQYDFAHAKMRQLAYKEMGLGRRRLLHRRVAESLQKSTRQETLSMTAAAEIARHYREAGMDDLAAHYFVKAGNQAQTLFAHQEGVYYYQSALALGFEQAWKLHEGSGDMTIRLGEYPAALSSYETAASMAGNVVLGRLEHKIGQVYIRQGAWTQAAAQLDLAQERITGDEDLARLLNDRSYVAFNLNQMEQAQQYMLKVRQLANTPQVRAQSENISGLLARHEGDLERALSHFEAAHTLAQDYHLPDSEIASLNNLALTEAALGRNEDAKAHFLAALERCQSYSDRHREAALHNNLADLFHQMGDEENAMAELKTAVAIYAEIGGQPGNWQPEIWKLTEW